MSYCLPRAKLTSSSRGRCRLLPRVQELSEVQFLLGPWQFLPHPNFLFSGSQLGGQKGEGPGRAGGVEVADKDTTWRSRDGWDSLSCLVHKSILAPRASLDFRVCPQCLGQRVGLKVSKQRETLCFPAQSRLEPGRITTKGNCSCLDSSSPSSLWTGESQLCCVAEWAQLSRGSTQAMGSWVAEALATG